MVTNSVLKIQTEGNDQALIKLILQKNELTLIHHEFNLNVPLKLKHWNFENLKSMNLL